MTADSTSAPPSDPVEEPDGRGPSAREAGRAPGPGRGPGPGLGRRAFLGRVGLVGAGGIAGGVTGALVEHATGPDGPGPLERQRARAVAAVRPAGPHQPGIAGPPAAHLVFTAYDLTGDAAVTPAKARTALRDLLTAWTRTAATVMAGEQPADGGQRTLGLAPSALTVTFGLGASALTRAGLTTRIPPQLAPIPAFPHDQLDPARRDGDLAVQICAEDPMVAASAARTLDVLARRYASPRWRQHGFRQSAAASAEPTGTPRNLMGQFDGTNNPAADTAVFDLAVWADTTAPAWMTGGSYLVARRIRMLLDRWDLLTVDAQEKVIGRRKSDGAPLSGGGEHTDPDFLARTADDSPVIPANSHVRLSHPQFNNGVRMLRRGYSYQDGLDADGDPDAGLFFLAYQADPRTAFTAVQRKLDRLDALSAFVRHTGSALFAVPPAAPAGGHVGQQLLES
ncbi:Dyp-type peroxidase [Frankia sp. AgPm24]|uniref:Dyp-type peroxidase n=1 Tax=Frankia sp. AgPm24 TaxID=631128 RepID=UPI00200E0C80|nr:Dyp-type peroxidase [Frankia sp. AgPm24]MCK9922579.1 Dyp-type peroxidase [Frankia sp. AgPm24]